MLAFLLVAAVAIAQNDPDRINAKEANTASRDTDIRTARARKLATEVVDKADRIENDRIRADAQWQVTWALVHFGEFAAAYEQAMKLKDSDLHRSILSLSTLAKAVHGRGDAETARRALASAIEANADSGHRYSSNVIQLCLAIDRPVSEAMMIAASTRNSHQRSGAYRTIRRELIKSGNLREAEGRTRGHIPGENGDLWNRSVVQECAAADRFDDAERVLRRIQPGAHRDVAISSLVGSLTTPNHFREEITEERITTAERWVRQIEDKAIQGQAKSRIQQKRLQDRTSAELEAELLKVSTRDEQLVIQNLLFKRLVKEQQFEEADAMLARQIQVIRDSPRPEVTSKFGRFNDDSAIQALSIRHYQTLIPLLIPAKPADARRLTQRLEELPDLRVFMVPSPTDVAQQMYLKMKDFTTAEAMLRAKHQGDTKQLAMSLAELGGKMIASGQVEHGLQLTNLLLEIPSAEVFPEGQPSRMTVYLHRDLVRAMLNQNLKKDAVRILKQIPEREHTAHAFRDFGGDLVASGRFDEFRQWLPDLPHRTARVFTMLGILMELRRQDMDTSSAKSSAAAPN